MEEINLQPKIPVLESAWRHYAEFDAKAGEVNRKVLLLKQLGFIFGLLAVLLAIQNGLDGIQVLIALLILAIVASLAALVGAYRIETDENEPVLRAGADEILKEIYLYRTILQHYPERRQWLLNRLAAIQHHVLQRTGNQPVPQTYTGALPPPSAGTEKGDGGFQDLNAEAYVKLRLESQIDVQIQRARAAGRQRRFFQILVLAIGGGSLVLAIFASIWAAFTTVLLLVVAGWGDTLRLDAIIRRYNSTITELRLLRDRWTNLESEERTEAEFIYMVQDTEAILWSCNSGQIPSAQAGQSWVQDEDARLVGTLLHKALEADAQMRQALQQNLAYTGKSEATPSQGLAAAERQLMPRAAPRSLQPSRQREPTLEETLKSVSSKYAGVKLTKETPKEVLNEVLKQYPPSGEVKG